MREISLDTETTGLSADNGDRIVEIGCVELINLMPTGNVYHVYINPGRAMSEGASQVTGLTDDFLRDKPFFEDIAKGFIDFIQDARLVIHNASFDIKFINAEFARIKQAPIDVTTVIDTLALARKRFPGAQATLDALCRRFQIDLSGREKHGALLDAELLAQVYLELSGGRQPGFLLDKQEVKKEKTTISQERVQWKRSFKSYQTPEEAEQHATFIKALGEKSIWSQIENTPKKPS